MDSVKSENYFENFDHRIGGIGHIESDKPNLAYMVGLCCIIAGLELSELNEVRKMYSFGWKNFSYIPFYHNNHKQKEK